jgi:VCBS repeat-containing protein
MVDKQTGAKTSKTSNSVAGRLNVKGAAHVAAAHDASSKAHGPITRVEVGPDGIVTLPAGVTPDQIHVQGHDLVVNLADGSEIIIINGAQNVPTLEMGNVELPGQNVIALLNIEGQPGVQPAAGPGGSAGGNFATPPGAIDPAFGIDPLLPPTELQFGDISVKELQQGIKPDTTAAPPTVTVPVSPATPAAPAPGVTPSPGTVVHESGLPTHGGLPAGSTFGDGSQVTSGTVTYTAPAGLASIDFNGQAIAQGTTITTGMGAFVVNSVNLTTGVITYTYTLNTNTSGQNTGDIFHVVVTDAVGQTAAGTFTVSIVDDVPTARADIASLAAGQYGPLTGNVETSNDTQGADGAHVSGVHGAGVTAYTTVPTGTGGVTVHGQYGDLTIHQDGSYSYARSGTSAGGVADVFNYQLTDGDGSTSTTTLTINIGNSTPTVTVTPNGPTDSASHGLVNEAGLAGGSHAGDGSTATTGVISYTPGDNPDTVTIGGVTATVGAVVHGTHGDLTVTGVDTTNHTVSYTYTLTSPVTSATANDGANNEGPGDTFAVVITDTDGSSATTSVVVDVTDDVPTAIADVNAIAAGAYGPVTGNVETNDIQGADGASVLGAKAAGSESFTAVAAGSAGSVIHGQYGDLTIHQDGSYSYARAAGTPGGVSDVFNYQLTDKDGDTSATTLTINIGDSTPTVTVTPGQPVDDAGHSVVNEAGLAGGSHAGNGSASVSGTVGYTPGDGPDTVTIGGVTVVDHGVVQTTGQIVGHNGYLVINGVDTNADTISYTYTLTNPLSGPGAGTNNEGPGDTFAVAVTDLDGSHANASVVVDVIDDVPSIQTVAVTTALTVDESFIPGVGSQTGPAGSQTDHGSFAGAFSVTPGADGVGSTAYGLHVDNAATNLVDSLSGQTVALVQVSGTEVDGVVTLAGVQTSVFKLTVDAATGQVSMEIDRGVKEGDPTSTNEATHLAGGLVSVTASVTDADGDPASASFDLGPHLAILDDSPTAHDNLNTVTVGKYGPVTGNVIAGTDIDSDGHAIAPAATPDLVGADGAMVSQVASVDLHTQATVTASGSIQIAGQFGVLTIDAQGDYSYTRNPNSPHGVDHFTYTLTDGDGDTSTAALNITVADALPGVTVPVLNPQDPTASAAGTLVYEAGLSNGSAPNSTVGAVGSHVTAGVITFQAGDLPDTITIGGTTVVDHGVVQTTGHIAGTNGYLEVTGVNLVNHTVSYQYTLTNSITEAPAADNGADFEGMADKFVVTVADADGASEQASATLTIGVYDDVPSATLSGGTATLSVDESFIPTIGSGAAPAGSATASASFASAFHIVGGADGAASVAYGLHIDNATTNLVDSVSGQTVTLLTHGANEVDGVVTLAGVQTTVFKLTVNASTGQVGMEIDRGVKEGDPTNANEGVTLGSGLVSVVANVTDYDGDTATAKIDLGPQITIHDDAPAITTSGTAPALTVDESFIPTIGSGQAPTGSATASASFASLFHITNGADGATTAYSLTLNNAATGLVDSKTGEAVVLHQVSATEVDGWTSSSHLTVFKLTVDASGNVGMEIDRGVKESNPNSANEGVTLASGLVSVTATATDGDGDKASASIDLGPQVTILDDGPLVTTSGTVPSLTVDESFIPTIGSGQAPAGSYQASASFASLFHITNGADGGTTAYSLTLNNAATGLVDSKTGEAVVLHQVSATEVDGWTSSSHLTVFKLTVDASGNVGMEIDRGVKESNTSSADEAITLGSGLVSVTATVTDGDGDTASASVDLGPQVTIHDDGPLVTTSGTAPALTVDESFIPTIGSGQAPTGSATASASFASLFHITNGADGATTAYGLNIGNTATGLVDSKTGEAVVLHQVSATEVDGWTSSSHLTVFKLTVDASGNVGMEIDRGVKESNPNSANEGVTLASGLVSLTATVTDGDGDKASASVDLGPQLTILDDGPLVTASGTAPTLTVDESFIPTIGSGTGPAGAYQASAAFASLFHVTPGADGQQGATTYGLHIDNATTSLVDTKSGQTVTLVTNGANEVDGVVTLAGVQTTVFKLIANASTGAVSMEIDRGVKEPNASDPNDTVTLGSGLVSVTATVTDNDGDTASAKLDLGSQITIHDDGPTFTAAPSSFTGTSAIGNVANNHVTGDLHLLPGADGAGTVTGLTLTAVQTGTSTAATADGHGLVVNPTGSIVNGVTTFSIYEDANKNGVWDSGDTVLVGTLGENPTAGTSGQYTFTLSHALDPTVTPTSLGGVSNQANGPNPAGDVLNDGAGHNLALLAAFNTSSAFSTSTLSLDQGVTNPGINGSLAGFGPGNNGLNNGDLMVIEFGQTTPFTNAGFTGAAFTGGPLVDYVDIHFKSATSGLYLMHYIDGTNSQVLSFSGAFTATAAAGEHLAYVEVYATSTGGGDKFLLGNVGVETKSIDDTLTFQTTVHDGDGDAATSSAFSVEVTQAASPVVLDLNGHGVSFVGEDAGVTFNYGSGEVSTAWAASGEGVLALQTANGPVVSFTGYVAGATTDLQGLTAFDTNHDGKLDAGDTQFAQFGAIVNGHFESLAQLGVASIDLTSDGHAYTAANGQVQVAGTGSFTYANGTTGATADAAFATQPVAKAAAQTQSADPSYADSLAAAAGVVAAASLDQQQPATTPAPATHDATQPAAPTVTAAQADNTPPPAETQHSPSVDTSSTTSSTQPVSDTGHSSSTDTGAQTHSVDSAAASVQGGSVPAMQPSVHDVSTSGPVHPVVLPTVQLQMVDSASLPVIKTAASQNGDASTSQAPGDHNGHVAAVVADALHGGTQGPDLNQLIDGLKSDQAASNDNGAPAPQGPAHTGLAYLDLHTGASESVNAALQQHHHAMVAHDMVSGAHHA